MVVTHLQIVARMASWIVMVGARMGNAVIFLGADQSGFLIEGLVPGI